MTSQQIAQYRLPTAPPKRTDNRAFHGMTCQAEALAPDVMNSILRAEIERRIDKKQMDRIIKREKQERQELLDSLETLT